MKNSNLMLSVSFLAISLIGVGCSQGKKTFGQSALKSASSKTYPSGIPTEINEDGSPIAFGSENEIPGPKSSSVPASNEYPVSTENPTVGEAFSQVKKIDVVADSTVAGGFRVTYKNASNTEISMKNYFSSAALVETADFYFLQMMPKSGTAENPVGGVSPYNLVVAKGTGKFFNLNSSAHVSNMDLGSILDKSAINDSGASENYVTLNVTISATTTVRYGFHFDSSRQELKVVTIS